MRFFSLLKNLKKPYVAELYAVFKNSLEEKGFSLIHGHLEKNFKDLAADQIYKVLSTILRSIKRHNSGARGYLNFAHQFAGA